MKTLFQKVIGYLLINNSKDKNLTKLAEELNELSSAVLQLHNKGESPERLEKVEEEYSHVILRLEVLNHYLNEGNVKKHQNKKLVELSKKFKK